MRKGKRLVRSVFSNARALPSCEEGGTLIFKRRGRGMSSGAEGEEVSKECVLERPSAPPQPAKGEIGMLVIRRSQKGSE